MIADDIWNSLFGGFGGMDMDFEDMASMLRENGGFAYGRSVMVGPDGIPHVREFGNRPQALIPERREVFTDVSMDGDTVRVAAELPGVEKQDVSLECDGTSLQITAESPRGTMSKTVALPCRVDESSAKAVMNNGILEVSFTSERPPVRGTRISIE